MLVKISSFLISVLETLATWVDSLDDMAVVVGVLSFFCTWIVFVCAGRVWEALKK